ncbi:unnamed protein product [Trifolium pratense]|uniref:Uncharacterized protein n=1 Tax=Trifolium pratense TaxID=57577 RepID=A0ACB0INQ9_TRIPR|nr:unnamed protein product [Trifolium pratense]
MTRTRSRAQTRKLIRQIRSQTQTQIIPFKPTSTSKTISAALKLVDSKKQNLKKAYDDLQSHSSHLSSFPLSWQDLDSHFTTIQNSLSQRFLHLQSLESQFQKNHNDPSTSPSKLPNPKPKNSNFTSIPNNPSTSPSKLPNPKPKNSNFSSIPNDPSSSSNPKSSISHLEALSLLCKNNDGKGLRDFVKENFNDRVIIKDELQIAFKSASNPANMVLDAIDGLFCGNVMVDRKDSRLTKRSCNFLFQQLRVFSPYVSFDVKEKAKKLFNEWKVNLNDSHEPSWSMAFLQFVAVYGFLVDLNDAELAAYSTTASGDLGEIPELFQVIALSDRVQGVIQKLIERGKHVLAVKFIFHFKLEDKTPPVPILKAFVNDAEQQAKRLAAEGKSLNERTSRQIHSLKSVIKVIETYNLDSEFPRASLEKRIDELNKKFLVGVKPTAPAFAANPHQHQQQLSGLERHLTSIPFGPPPVLNNVGGANSTIHQYRQQLLPRFQSTSLLPDHPNPYMSMPPPTMSFGMKAPTPTVSSYTGPSTGPYGFGGVPKAPTPSSNLDQVGSHPNSAQPQVFSGYYAPMAASGNLNQGGSHPNASVPQVMPAYYAPTGPSPNLHQGSSHPNPSEPQVMPGNYDRPPASGAYGLQQYYGTSYPQ